MKTIVLVIAATLVLGVGVPPAGADEPQAAGLHRSTGLVVRVNTGLGSVVMKVNDHVHALAVTKATVLRNDWGEPLAGLRALQVGDYVREECVAGPEGKFLARKIELLRPAWRDLESPEQ